MRILLFVRFFLLYFVVSLFSFCCCFFQLSGTLSHRILIFLLYFLYRLRKFSPYILKIFVITCYPVLWHHVIVILVSRLFFWGVFFSILSNYCSPPLYWYVFLFLLFRQLISWIRDTLLFLFFIIFPFAADDIWGITCNDICICNLVHCDLYTALKNVEPAIRVKYI